MDYFHSNLNTSLKGFDLPKSVKEAKSLRDYSSEHQPNLNSREYYTADKDGNVILKSALKKLKKQMK